MRTLFSNRKSAGELLAHALTGHAGDLVIGLPRGGVVVAAVVAQALHLPLDVLAPRKLSHPYQRELALGALCGETIVSRGAITDEEILRGKEEEKRRLTLYRKGKPPLKVKGKRVIVVDDGVATGATLIASLRELKRMGAKKLTAAIPVSPSETLELLKKEADEVICLETPEPFYAVGQFYESFPDVSDGEVLSLLSTSSIES